MSLHDHATACLELTLLALARERRAAERELNEHLDDIEPLTDLNLLEVDEAMWLFEHATLAALEYATALGITEPN